MPIPWELAPADWADEVNMIQQPKRRFCNAFGESTGYVKALRCMAIHCILTHLQPSRHCLAAGYRWCSERESKADDHAQLSFTLNPFTRKSQLHKVPYIILLQALRRWECGEATGMGMLKVVATTLHVGGSGHMVVFYRQK